MKKIEFRAMGCKMSALVDSHSRRAVARLLQVPDWFEEWEQSLSRFRPNSELNRLNASHGRPFAASRVLWDVLLQALQARLDSGGLVSPDVLNALEWAGYDRSFEMIQAGAHHTAPGAENPQPAGSLEDLDLDPATRTIKMPPGLRLDFGGVAKGWAAHQAARRLSHYSPALVNAGGDIAISGPGLDGSDWAVGINNPFKPGEDLALMHLKRGGSATSGSDYRRWQQGTASRHHIIDPRAGLPSVSDILSATVAAPDVLQAEMAAKTVFILGSRDGLDWINRRPGHGVYMVLAGGAVLTNSAMRKLLGAKDD